MMIIVLGYKNYMNGEKNSISDEFTIDKTSDITIKWIWKDITSSANNPATGDNLFFYITFVVLSIAGLTGIEFYIKKKNLN